MKHEKRRVFLSFGGSAVSRGVVFGWDFGFMGEVVVVVVAVWVRWWSKHWRKTLCWYADRFGVDRNTNMPQRNAWQSERKATKEREVGGTHAGVLRSDIRPHLCTMTTIK